MRRTPIRPLIGRDIAKVDDMFGVQSLDEGSEPVLLDLPNRHNQCPDSRRSDGQEGIQTHASTRVIPPNFLPVKVQIAISHMFKPARARRGKLSRAEQSGFAQGC